MRVFALLMSNNSSLEMFQVYAGKSFWRVKLLSHYEEQDLAKDTQIWCSWKILHVILVYSCLFLGTSQNILAES